MRDDLLQREKSLGKKIEMREGGREGGRVVTEERNRVERERERCRETEGKGNRRAWERKRGEIEGRETKGKREMVNRRA